MRLVCGLVLKSSGRARKTESLAGQRQTERENRRTVSFLRVFNNTVAERESPTGRVSHRVVCTAGAAAEAGERKMPVYMYNSVWELNALNTQWLRKRRPEPPLTRRAAPRS